MKAKMKMHDVKGEKTHGMQYYDVFQTFSTLYGHTDRLVYVRPAQYIDALQRGVMPSVAEH